jgi:MFS family permease
VPLIGALALVIADHTVGVRLAFLYLMVLAAGVSWAFDSPSRAALLPTLVPREALPRAVTLASTNQALAFTTGPAVGGLIIAHAGVGAVYVAYVVLMALSVLTLVALESPPRQGPGPGLTLAAVREGLAFVWRNQVILGCMTLDMLAVVFGGATALLPIYATDILHVGARGYGLLSASLEVGALLMAAILTVLPPIRHAGRALLVTVAVYGIATIVFGLSRWYPLSVLAYMAVGMADHVSVVLRSTAVQLTTPDALRGRVSGVNMIFIGASNQLGAAESGFVAALTSPTFSVASGGLASLLVVATVAARMPALRRYRIGR